jgi:hypothetical protein
VIDYNAAAAAPPRSARCRRRVRRSCRCIVLLLLGGGSAPTEVGVSVDRSRRDRSCGPLARREPGKAAASAACEAAAGRAGRCASASATALLRIEPWRCARAMVHADDCEVLHRQGLCRKQHHWWQETTDERELRVVRRTGLPA